ncbi:Uncharacterized membrane protein [Flagellimonas taeanensis]|jgi:uncharacterized membrane protein|uniref:Uncharacterized membrane protein n=1 Tax=Flagellimonas taeanensis TaxID=1005926 RepID=A0A1M6RE71_9FLAO|nr:hypothetical protein [Allomuricauda taeanensis]MEE1963602.1 hypothetical protein [Allomuricauda taeanensis]SFB75052.1 Uncharacterized membrane protein [Allomuricauda taeanensis]SHK30706.1 Uncharacterized membrane protein [Allomuricauda taeanensis]
MKNIAHNNADMKEGKNTAIIAYCTIIGLIIAFILNSSKKNPFASFHLKQSLGLGLTGLTLYIIGKVPYVGGVLNLLGLAILFYMWVMGLMNAINGAEKPVPLLGNAYKELFKNI